MLLTQQMHERWLDRVWSYLCGDSGGLVTPGQIRREALDRVRVRQAELAAIAAAEAELSGLRAGRKIVGYGGRVADAVAVGDVPMYSIIERPPLHHEEILARSSQAQSLLDSVALDNNRRDALRLLVIRRIALLAEEEILASFALHAVSEQEIGAHWFQRWRQHAQDVHEPELQRLWARLLVREVAQPGQQSPALIDVLEAIDERDLPGIALLARYVFGEFIFDARGRYFRPELHDVWLAKAEALGLLQSIEAHRYVNLHPAPDNEPEPLLLINHRRALQLSVIRTTGVALPVLRITPLGKQLFHLVGGEADMAYLLDLAAYLTEHGVKVALGDWQPLRRHFDKKIEYS